MAYSDESLKAKLSTLNETQDSIVSVSQWIMFHKRHADRIASYWLTRLRDSPPPKRLNFIYLVNDIVQNARARKRDEFPNAFSPLMPEAVQTAYRSSTPDIQTKIRRVVEVWRGRNVFEVPIQEAIEARLDEVDKTKGTSKKTLMGNSLFSTSAGSGMPKELEALGPLQVAVTKATITARPSIDTASTEYQKLNDPDTMLPSPPVHAARLSALMKALANAESSVAESIKARKELIAGLEKILATNRDALTKDETTYLDLSSRKTSTEAKKKEVEDGIMRGLSIEPLPTNGAISDPSSDMGPEPERPEFEALTPEATTPIGSPPLAPDDSNTMPLQSHFPFNNPEVQDILASMSGGTSRIRRSSSGSGSANFNINGGMGGGGGSGFSAKRRKIEEVPDLGDLDEDVDELLRQEGARV